MYYVGTPTINKQFVLFSFYLTNSLFVRRILLGLIQSSEWSGSIIKFKASSI